MRFTLSRNSLLNFTLALGSVTLCLAFVELGARWIEYRRVHPAGASASGGKGAFQFHAVLGWTPVPSITRRIQRSEFDIEMRINSLGLRGPERAYRKPPGTRRVLVLGDSFAAGYYVSETETLAAVLERRLASAQGDAIEVVNAGVPGYSTDQEYLFYHLEGCRYAADVVVLLFYYNDLFNNVSPITSQGEPKPWFETVDDRATLRNAPLTPRGTDDQERPSPELERILPWRGSVALRLLGLRTEASAPRLHHALAGLGLVPPDSADPHGELWVFGPGADNPAMWKTTRALLRALRDAVASNGARLVVLYVPVRFEVNESVWELTRKRYTLGRRWRREKVFEHLEASCAALGVPLVDPRVPLRAAEGSPHPAYFTRDVHWTPAGNAAAAASLEPAVRAALSGTSPQTLKD